MRTALAGALIASAAVAAAATPHVRPGTWRRLERPLHLPAPAPGAGCPRSRSGRAAPDTYFTLGPGPAYPVFGTRHGVAVLRKDELRAGAYWRKTLWAIRPGYRGPVLVRGRRIDGPGILGFALGFRATTELRFRPARRGRRRWRYAPSATVIPRSGCYALQIDGTSFSRVVVFSAR